MSDELRAEHDFDYQKAKPNRFAAKMKKGGRLVVLEPEVATAFDDSAAVNAALKALLETMPPKPHGPTEAALGVERESEINSPFRVLASTNAQLYPLGQLCHE